MRLVVAAYGRLTPRQQLLVTRLTTPPHTVGAFAVLRRPDGRVLLVDPPYVEGWSLPGGHLAGGETVAEGLAREVREELGLDLVFAEPVLAVRRPASRVVTFVTLMDVDDATADRARVVSPEHREVRWFAPGAFPPLHADVPAPLALVGVLPA